MDKKELRKIKMHERDSLSRDEAQALSDIITEKILSLKEYKEADTILTYVSCRSEVITDNLILAALNDGKKVGVPKVESDIMNFYYINSLDELKAGYFGVREPVVSQNTSVSLSDNNGTVKPPVSDPSGCLMIVPGLAFDKDLNRIGYGKGFYDKYFQSHMDTPFTKCGIAFDIQLCEKIEADPYDQPLDMLVTENSVILSEAKDLKLFSEN